MPWCSILRLHPCISPQKWRGGHQGTWPEAAPFPSSSLLPRGSLQHTTWCTWTAVVATWVRWTWPPCPCLACPWVLIRNTADISLVGPIRKSLYKWHCTGSLGGNESLSGIQLGRASLTIRVFQVLSFEWNWVSSWIALSTWCPASVWHGVLPRGDVTLEMEFHKSLLPCHFLLPRQPKSSHKSRWLGFLPCSTGRGAQSAFKCLSPSSSASIFCRPLQV